VEIWCENAGIRPYSHPMVFLIQKLCLKSWRSFVNALRGIRPWKQYHSQSRNSTLDLHIEMILEAKLSSFIQFISYKTRIDSLRLNGHLTSRSDQFPLFGKVELAVTKGTIVLQCSFCWELWTGVSSIDRLPRDFVFCMTVSLWFDLRPFRECKHVQLTLISALSPRTPSVHVTCDTCEEWMRTISFMNESFTFIHRLSKDLRPALTHCPAIAALHFMNRLIVLVPFRDILRNIFTWWLKAAILSSGECATPISGERALGNCMTIPIDISWTLEVSFCGWFKCHSACR
jgi:hypothetical protein